MRILSIVLQYPPARRIGAELYDHELHKALTKEGHEVQVVTVEDETKNLPSWEFEGIRVNAPITGEYDLILTHIDMRQKAWFIARLNSMTHLPIIGIHHNNAPGTVTAEKLYLWDGIIYNSEHAKNLGSNSFAKKTVLIPPVKTVGKTTLSKGTKIVQVNLNNTKGGDKFWNLARTYPDHEFLAVKGGWGQQNIPQNIPSNVTVLPSQEDLTEVWKEAGLLLILSTTVESWGMVAAEAGRHGVPSITFNDIPGVIENIGNSGFIVPRSPFIKLPEYSPNKATQQHFSKQATLHRKQLKDTVKFLEGFEK